MATDTCVPLRHPGLQGFGSRQEPVVVVAGQVGGLVVGRTDARHDLCERVEVNVGTASNNQHVVTQSPAQRIFSREAAGRRKTENIAFQAGGAGSIPVTRSRDSTRVNESPPSDPFRVMMSGVDDQGRVEAVYRSLHPRLWRSLLAYTGDAEVASDAEAEAFAQVLRRGEAVDDVAAWVWRSAFHRLGLAGGYGRAPAGSVRRRARRHQRVRWPSSWDSWPTSPRSSGPVSRCATSAGTRRDEIGELLGTSAGTVRVQLHRAHAALRHTILEAEHA